MRLLKEILFTADLTTSPDGIEPIRVFLCNVKTRVLFTMPACEQQQLHADVVGMARPDSTADSGYFYPCADADVFFMWGVPRPESGGEMGNGWESVIPDTDGAVNYQSQCDFHDSTHENCQCF